MLTVFIGLPSRSHETIRLQALNLVLVREGIAFQSIHVIRSIRPSSTTWPCHAVCGYAIITYRRPSHAGADCITRLFITVDSQIPHSICWADFISGQSIMTNFSGVAIVRTMQSDRMPAFALRILWLKSSLTRNPQKLTMLGGAGRF